MVQHSMQDINEELAQIYWQMYVSGDRIKKEQCLKKDVVEQDKAEEVLKAHLVNWWDLLKKVENNKAFKRVAGAVLKEVPDAIGNLSKRVKNKKLKSILYSDMTKTGVDLATGYALDELNN